MTLAGELSRLVERARESRDAAALERNVRFERPTLVLGSAPNPSLPVGWSRADPLVTINAAQVSAEALGLGDPTLTVLSVTVLGTSVNSGEVLRVLAGRRTGNLLAVSHPDEWARDGGKLDDIGYRAGRVFRVTTRRRGRVVLDATGEDAGRGDPNDVKVSNGVYAVCQVLALGAPQVVVAGFSLSGGHSYNALGRGRLHVGPDARAFASLAARWPQRLFAASDAVATDLQLPLWPAPS